MKIIVSAGGSGGHIYPALAIIKKFQEKEKDLEVLYIGTHNRMEKDIVPNEGINYEAIEIYGFNKSKIFRNIKNIYLISKAKKRCKEIMKEFKPDVVIGVGGYVTYPVISAAHDLNIKTVIHEQNSIPGKSNITLSRLVDLIFVSFKNSANMFPKNAKIIYSGNPCGDRALTIKKYDKTKLGFSKNKKLIIIVGGSLGSSTMNEKFKTFLKLVEDEDYEILYITGNDLYDDFKEDKYPKNVKIVPFFENLSSIIKESDLIISRAGATTISEILALKKPSILIPSPYVANNHQYYNAIDLESMGVSTVIEEKNLNPERLQITINEILNDSKKHDEIIKNLNNLKQTSASDIIYEEIKKLL